MKKRKKESRRAGFASVFKNHAYPDPCIRSPPREAGTLRANIRRAVFSSVSIAFSKNSVAVLAVSRPKRAPRIGSSVARRRDGEGGGEGRAQGGKGRDADGLNR